MRSLRAGSMTLVAVVAVSLTIGCTSEKIVYRSGTNFAAPTTAAASFIGYADVTNKQTVCGSCHIDKQVAWQGTKHASAWGDLQASGGAQGFCEACHTVSNLGNAVTDTAVGYRSTKDARYHDVQCESCHGAGLNHAGAPNATNRPLASIQADTNIKNGCGECHSGSHDPFVNEWRASGHSKTFATSHQSTDPYCQGCHTAQGALLAWQKGGNYVEKGSTAMLDITCAVCHDPHAATNSAQLRFPINVANADNNLCVKCHQRRGNAADVTTRNSVHAPEGPTLFGTAGWFPPGMSTSDSIFGTHSSPAKNPKLCAGCHVQKFQDTDPVTKKAVFSTGHRFLASPCVDASGLPTTDQTCASTAMTFRSCVGSNCHGTEAAARNSFNTANLRIANLVTQANTLITQAKAGPKGSECTFVAGKPYTTCMGIQFNISVATKVGGVIHNPFLAEQLMIASINQMKKDYNLTVSANLNLEPEFQRPSGGTR